MKGIKIDYFNDERKSNIINDYLNGVKSSLIAKNHSISKNTVLQFLRKNNYSNNIKKNYYAVYSDFFKIINCSEKSWVLGWIMADGCVYNNRLQISLHKKDEDVIDKIKYFLNYEGIKNYYNNKYVGINIYNAKLSDDLSKLGCISRKSLVLKFPTQINKENCRHFIRGYFEGDGSVNLNKRRNYIKINFKGTLETLSEIKKRLFTTLKINCSISKPNNCIDKNTFDLTISGNIQSIKFLNYIYKHIPEEIRMNRKYNRAKELHEIMMSNRKRTLKSYKKLNLEF